MKRFAVVGGGITGLAAAYYLEKFSPEAEVTLFERSGRLGGVISTPQEDGFRYELGPDSFLSYKQAALDLVEELGITDRVINANVRSVYVVRNGKLAHFPAGFQFFVPTGWGPLLKTPLISWPSKIGVAREALRHRGKLGADLSVAQFTRERFGNEVCEYLAEPLLSGIYGGDAELLSMRAVLPQFLHYEETHGNVIRGVIAGARNAQKSKPRFGAFVSFREGMQELPDAIVSRLARTRFCINHDVDQIPAGYDGVVLATPPVHSARLSGVAPDVADILATIPCASTVTVSLFYRDGDLPTSDGGFGFVVPRVENRKILACSWVSSKFAGRAPAGYTYVRGFLSGIHSTDDALTTVLSELRDIMGVKRDPERVRVAHWPEVMAQPLVGHREKIAELRRRMEMYPGLEIAGNFLDGIGIPDCIRTAKLAAEKLAA